MAAQAQKIPEALLQVVKKTVDTNPEVQARWQAFLAADAERRSAFGTFRPQIDLKLGVIKEKLTRPTGDVGPYTSASTEITLKQTLFDGSFTASEVERFSKAQLVRYYELLDSAESAAYEALKAYIDVLRYRESVELAKANYVLHKQIADQIAERLKAGVGKGVDAAQAAGRLALAESNLLTETANLHDVSARYLRIVGELPPERMPDIPEQLKLKTVPPTLRQALETAYLNNPAMNAAIENVDALVALVGSRQSYLKPRVDLQLKAGRDRNLNGVDGSYGNRSAQIVMSYNLYNGGADKARELVAARQVDQALDVREKTCRDIRQNVMIAYHDVKNLRAKLEFLDQHRLSAEKAREAYRQQYDLGQRTLLDLLDTQNEYFESNRSYNNGRYDLALAEARTVSGMGELMKTLGVVRKDLPLPQDIGQDRQRDLTGICTLNGSAELEVDKTKLLAEAAPLNRQQPLPAPAVPPAPRKVTFSADAFFDFDKSILKPEGKQKLTEFVNQLKANKLEKEALIAVGHTDSRGSDQYNIGLSLRRATAVKAFLISQGLRDDQITVQGKGESEPIATNDTDEGRARNRRVEIIFAADLSRTKVVDVPIGATVAAAQPAQALPPEVQAVEQAVRAWARAWSARDMQAYLGAYSGKFEPTKGVTQEQWREQRRQRIETRKSIQVDLSDIRIKVQGDQASATFTQYYESDRLRDTSTKTLKLVRENGRWLIVSEQSE
ncbi:MAG: hypothetical protein OHK0048_08660 [Rhodoferax sp.]